MDDDQPVLPADGAGSVCELIPGLLDPEGTGAQVVGPEVLDAASVVVLVIDGLGWHQLQERRSLAPTLASMAGEPVTTVAPSTTATALTSIVTGTPPGEHGMVGYRIDVEGEVLNALRWTTPRGDARERIPPAEFQCRTPFGGQRPVVVQNAEFARSGFTMAHLRDARLRGWYTLAGLVVEVRRAVRDGEPFVYAYYDGIDKTAHLHGFGEFYDAELVACDRLVADLMTALPRGTALVVTADHGLVDCRGMATDPDPDVLVHVERQSGEARFRWLHATPGRERDLLEVASAVHADRAWVRSRDQVIDGGWMGPSVSEAARSRLGDVAIVARDRWYFTDRADNPSVELVGRHGSLTAEEMIVPMLGFVR